MCVNLSHFPGDFSPQSATFIFNFKENLLNILVKRSLLQYNRPHKRYYFHTLLQSFFITKQSGRVLRHFRSNFQLYFARFLSKIIPDNGQILHLDELFYEELNIVHLFTMFTNHSHVKNTFYAIKVISHEYRMQILLQLLPTGLNVALVMLDTLESYVPEERASIKEFVETHIKITILAARLEEKINNKVAFLLDKQYEVEEGLKQGVLSIQTFTKFYRTLGQFLKDYGDKKGSVWCHTRVLRVTWNQLGQCYPDCDYFSISVAYEIIADKEQAFHFRKLAYKSNQNDMEPMGEAKLVLGLYNDYLDKSLGNNMTKAKELSTIIRDEVYPYLLMADKSEYLEEVYFAAIKLFKAKNMQEHVLKLQKKVFNLIKQNIKCDKSNAKCSHNLASALSKALKNKWFYVAVSLGKENFTFVPKVTHLSYIIGKSFYLNGNYPDSQKWLTTSLELVNVVLQREYSSTYRSMRFNICYYLIMSGNLTNIPCYGYIIKYATNSMALFILHEIHEKFSLGNWTKVSTVALTVETQKFYLASALWYT